MDEYIMKSKKTTFLADGFPRNQENVDVWNKLVGDRIKKKFIVLLDVKPEVSLGRLQNRAKLSTVKRADDTLPIMSKRIAEYETLKPFFNQFIKTN